MDAEAIERLIRGLSPWPSAYSHLDGKTVKLWKAQVCEEDLNGDDVLPGEIVGVSKDSIFVKTGKGLLAVKELQLEGKKRMDAGAFLRGYSLKAGDRMEE